MLWIKSLHIIFMVTWFAGLFYLPRLFVYHAMAEDTVSRERFKIMERKLYWGIMTPGGVLTLVFGVWLWLGWFRGASSWLHVKMALGAVLAGYHLWCGMLLRDFRELVANQRAQLLGIFQDLGELGDGRLQLAPLGLELDAAESSEPAQRHLEDVIGLDLRQVEHVHEPGAGLSRVI